MPKISQAYEFVNDMTKQVIGQNAQTVVDTGSFVAMGDTIINNATYREKWNNVLTDRIAKTVIVDRTYRPKISSIMMDEFTYGSILQKISFDLTQDAVENKEWDLQNGHGPSPTDIYKAPYHQKLFNHYSTWSLRFTIPNDILRSAFSDERTMTAFLTGLMNAADISMKMKEEVLERATVNNFIGQTYYDKKNTNPQSVRVIKLLTLWNDLTAQGLTTAAALRDVNFWKFATATISLWKSRLSDPSVLFNIEGRTRYTYDDNLKILMLADFSKFADSYLSSDTYHNELVALPGAEIVNYWQSPGQSYAWDDVSGINIEIEVAGAKQTVEQKNIVAVMFDDRALGCTIFNKGADTFYNPAGPYTNYFFRQTVGFFNDLGENFIVFDIEEEEA